MDMNELNIANANNEAEIAALLGDIDEIIESVEGELVEDDVVETPVAASQLLNAPEVELELAESDATSDEFLSDAVRELEIADAKAEAYAGQESVVGEDLNTELPEPIVASTTEEVAAKEEKVKRKRESSEGKKKSQIITSHLGAESAGFFALEIDDAELDTVALKEREKATLEVIDALPKKVGEKATNLFNYLKTGEHLSVYTKIAFDLLLEKTTFTSEDLRNKMLAEGYTTGTSNSQAQQMMQLLPTLKVGVRVKSLMTRNPDSMILAKYEAAKATPAAS